MLLQSLVMNVGSAAQLLQLSDAGDTPCTSGAAAVPVSDTAEVSPES